MEPNDFQKASDRMDLLALWAYTHEEAITDALLEAVNKRTMNPVNHFEAALEEKPKK